jgi:hypothetical protein
VFLSKFFKKTFGEETAVRKIRERDLLYFCCISNNPQKRERGREREKKDKWMDGREQLGNSL